MKAAVVLANQYIEPILDWLEKNTRLRGWEHTYTGTCSSLYHGWGACMHFQHTKRHGMGYSYEFNLLHIYVHMDEDKVTYSYQTPGYQPRTQHETHHNFTYETLNELDRLFRDVPWNTQKRGL
jgi:hypothetical protein